MICTQICHLCLGVAGNTQRVNYAQIDDKVSLWGVLFNKSELSLGIECLTEDAVEMFYKSSYFRWL